MVSSGGKIKKWTARELESWTHSELVGPHRARVHLQFNTLNRNMRSSLVAEYVSAMLAGEWQITGEPISFAFINGERTLVNGQHRLQAIIDSGTEQWFSVTEFPSEIDGLAVQRVMDLQPTRLPAERHTIRCKAEGRTPLYASQVATLSAWAVAWDKGWRTNINKANKKVAAWERDAYLADHEDELVAAAKLGSAAASQSKINSGGCNMAALLFRRVSPDFAQTFMSLLGDGHGLAEGDPILAMRSINMKWMSQGERPSSEVVLGYLIHTWNLWVDGARVKNIVRRTHPGKGGVVLHGFGEDEYPTPKRPRR